ncbi:MAG: hypothetical protein ACP5I8_06450 [Phycisphaerae bacterium]
MLIGLALWLWPKMRQVYSLPDSSVITYHHALHHLVPPGTGRVTRTAVIERVLAAELGQLSDLAARPEHTNVTALRGVLRRNARMGRWAAAVMTIPRSRRMAIFNWGMRPNNLPVVNLAFSRWSADRVVAVHELATISAPPADTLLAILLRDPVSMVHLSVMSALWNRQPTPAEIRILRHWTTDQHPYGFARHRKWKMFLFGRQAVNSQPGLYRMDRQIDLTRARHFASILLARWKSSTVADNVTRPIPTLAALTPTAPSRLGASKAAEAALRSDMATVAGAITALAKHPASVTRVNTALAAEYRTLVTVTITMPWPRQLAEIMRFNAAMARWIYIIARLPTRPRRAMLNWARFRTQDVELMRLVMSRRRSQRLRTVAIAPKLHGVERSWLIHRLLMDQRVSVELAMLHALWEMPPTPRLVRVVSHWIHVDPLPKGHARAASHTFVFNARRYVVKRTVSAQRYQQARRIGAMLLIRWRKSETFPKGARG